MTREPRPRRLPPPTSNRQGSSDKEEPPAPEDVDSPEPPYIPLTEELEDAPPPDENAMSSGTSFEELSDAADVLVRGTTDEERRIKAAKTLHDVQNTEIFDFLVREVCSADAIDSLLRECLDGDGFPLKIPTPVMEFDIGRYV